MNEIAVYGRSVSVVVAPPPPAGSIAAGAVLSFLLPHRQI